MHAMRTSFKIMLLSSLFAAAAALAVVLSAPAPALAAHLGFPDVGGQEWYVQDGTLRYAVEHGLITGNADGSFGGGGTVSRAQAVTVIWRAAGRPSAWSASFPDCDYSDQSFYGDAVRWARAEGVVSGYEDGRFGPGDPVTREQLAKMVADYARSIGVDVSGSGPLPFVDAAQVSSGFEAQLAWCVERGIISGEQRADGVYANPRGLAERCQLVKIMAIAHRDVIVPRLGYEPEPVYHTDDLVMLTGVVRRGSWQHPTLGSTPFYVLYLDRPATFVMDEGSGQTRYTGVTEVQIWDGEYYPVTTDVPVVVRARVFFNPLTHWARRSCIVSNSTVTPL